MTRLWRLLFCVATLALVAHCQDHEADEIDTDATAEVEGEEDEDQQGEDDEHNDEDGHDGADEEEEQVQGDEDEDEDDLQQGDNLDKQTLDYDEEDDAEPAELTDEQLREIHHKIDTNNDGKISLPEVLLFTQASKKASAVKKSGEELQTMDNDDDGKVSLQEAMYHSLEPMVKQDAEAGESSLLDDSAEGREKSNALREFEEAKFHAADKNGDGFLDDKEMPAFAYPETHEKLVAIMADNTLKHRDADHDGQLSFREFWGDEDKYPQDSAERELHVKDLESEFKLLDKDGSGKLSKKEIETYESGEAYTTNIMTDLLKIIDSDNDHHISLEELDKHLADAMGTDVSAHFAELFETEL